MELNAENDKILLVGEANFSFSLSLCNYVNPCLVTATCYENKAEAMRKYGSDLILQNERALRDLGCNRVLFEIDACQLRKHFDNEKFNRIIFMFPHVGGKSNLKKNRQLLNDFFASAIQVLDVDPNENTFDQFERSIANDSTTSNACIFVALAKGQGGTRFEQDPAKRNNKDCWQILNRAQENGLILTDCFNLDQSKYVFYRSTGFRSQSKSFYTSSSLIHKFEISLKLSNQHLVESFLTYSKFLVDSENFLSQNCCFNQFKNSMIKHLKESFLINCIADSLDFVACDSFTQKNVFHNKIDGKYIRNSMNQTLEKLKHSFKPNELNILSGLCLDEELIDESIKNDNELLVDSIDLRDLNELKCYQILLSYSGSNFDVLKESLLNFIKSIITNDHHLKQVESKCSSSTHLFFESKSNQKPFMILTNDPISNEIVACLNVDQILAFMFNLDDKRLLYSNDRRVFSYKNFKVIPYSIENTQWTHDISFWYKPKKFSMRDVLGVVLGNCQNQLVSMCLLDKYTKEVESDEAIEQNSHSACYRLVYQSCDRALSWESTKQINNQIRKKLSELDFLILR